MRAEGLSIALRARTPWEATDLGIALVREYAVPIWRAWACVVLPTALLLGLLCQLLGNVSIASLLLWWLKPVFDRIPLYVLSRAVFGAVPNLQDTLRAQRSRADFWPLFAQLTWRRFHPMRALFLPVDFLERLTGAQRSARTRLLARAQGSPSALLTIVCVNMETMLLGSIVLSAVIFVPTEFFSDAMRDTLQHLLTEPPPWVQWALFAAYTLALSIIEPIYVGAGFGLYLNRRMELEAWDIDLAFRQLAARLHERASSAARALQFALLLAVAGAGALHSDVSYAAIQAESDAPESDAPESEAPESDAPESDALAPIELAALTLEQNLDEHFVPPNAKFDASIKKALAGPELNPKATIVEWQRKVPELRAKKAPAMNFMGFDWLANSFGFLLQNALWILLVIALVLLLPYLLRLFGALEPRTKSTRSASALSVFDAELATTLPPDIAAAVTQLWHQGDRRGALALLYRAGVLRLCERLGQPLPLGATESECLRMARELADADDHRVLFPALVKQWQGIAYASCEPSWVEVQSLLARWQADAMMANQRARHGAAQSPSA